MARRRMEFALGAVHKFSPWTDMAASTTVSGVGVFGMPILACGYGANQPGTPLVELRPGLQFDIDGATVEQDLEAGTRHLTVSSWSVLLRYRTSSSTVVNVPLQNPYVDPALGLTLGPPISALISHAQRLTIFPPAVWTLRVRTSTYDDVALSFAADGQITVELNETPIYTLTGLTLHNGQTITATKSAFWGFGTTGDADNLWATARATIPDLDSNGEFVSGPPSELMVSDNFNDGDQSGWTAWGTAPYNVADVGAAGSGGLAWYDPVVSGEANRQNSGVYLQTTITPPDEDVPESGLDPDEPPLVAPSYDLETRAIRRLRRAPHLAAEGVQLFYRTLQVDLEPGVGVPTGQGEDPIVLLRVSRDGGHTWSEPWPISAGALGQYATRVIARRLGRARDAVFEIVVSDPVAWHVVGAWLDAEPGTH